VSTPADPADIARGDQEVSRPEDNPTYAERHSTECAPSALFDRATDARERAIWATQVGRLLSSDLGINVPQGVGALALLPSDVIAAWKDEIESNDRTVIVTTAPARGPGFADSAPIIFELIPVKHSAVTGWAAEPCLIMRNHRAEDVAAAAIDGCTHFRWVVTNDDQIDLEARIMFPLDTRSR
jgi:hypothetical protein